MDEQTKIITSMGIETLEKAAKKSIPDKSSFGATARNGFIKGAKWQSEKMFTNEEVESLLHKFIQSQIKDWHGYSTTKWFEQYKK